VLLLTGQRIVYGLRGDFEKCDCRWGGSVDFQMCGNQIAAKFEQNSG